jgi:uncharacterized protein (TIGR02599 family)
MRLPHSSLSRFFAPRPTRRRANAFTLVELLVSIAILSILVLLLCGILNQISTSWTQIRAQIDRRQNGETILGLIYSDLRVALLPENRMDTNSLQFMVDPVGLLTTPGYLYPHAVFWQGPIATNTTNGNIAEVGYFIRWDTTTTPSNPRATLCRFFVNPSDANYLIYSNPANWLTPATSSGSILDAVAPANLANNYQGWFADNVIVLWVRCLDANGMPITQTASALGHQTDSKTTNYSFDSRQGYLASNAGGATPTYITKTAYYDPGMKVEAIQSALPSTVEIAIVLIDSQTANHVTAVPSYTPFNMSPTLPSGAKAAVTPYTSNSPADFWNDINFFLANLKSTQPNVARGAHVYSISVPLANGG